MPTVHFLGTGGAVTDAHRTTTMLAFTDADHTFVVDCGGDVVQRLQAAGIPLETVESLFITHEHPDHVSGFALFLEKIWLAGREAPIHLYGIRPALEQAHRVFMAFGMDEWDLPELIWHEVACEENARVLDDEVWHITASPGVHSVPVVGLRVESKTTGGVVAYSCDTEPSGSIARMATDANVLVHEANGEMRGHSSPEAAAAIAHEVGVDELVLIHLPPNMGEARLAEARATFAETYLATELGTRSF